MDQRIAITGMAGRFPDARNLDELSDNLKKGRCSIGEISPERLRKTTLPPNEYYHRRGYMDNIDEFDYHFFQIPYGEAVHMDPHQRLLLEVTAEAIENAGYDTDALSGTNTGVYAANRNLQYYQHADTFDPTLITGNASEFLAARISRAFNLKGGVAVIDTSCSSGLVAVHHACNDLLLGHIDLAVVCAANLELFPFKDGQYHIEVDSPDGLSLPFSGDSNGMVYGEAVMVVLLKTVIRATLDRDHIHAVIRGTAVNNNAAGSASLTAPDSRSQAEVLQKAWAAAGVEPDQLSFIEAHGSGTQLGDSLEIAGINQATEPFSNSGVKIPISTIKSNIGHTRSAAGLAGLVKAVLAIRDNYLFPSVFHEPPNRHLQLANSRLYLRREGGPFVDPDRRMTGGVSSIGFSGTNCHAVVEAYHREGLNGRQKTHGSSFLFVFSSWTAEGLTEYCAGAVSWLQAHPAVSATDLSFTLGAGRKHYAFRKAFIAEDRAGLVAQLSDFTAARSAADSIAASAAVSVITPAIDKHIFIFSDADTLQYEDVQSLLALHPYFNAYYRQYLDQVSVGIERSAPRIFRFIFQLAYFEFLRHNGVDSSFLLGMGSGKIITRVIRGEISIVEGLRKIYEVQEPSQAETNMADRVDKLLTAYTGDGLILFQDMALGSGLYAYLNTHPDLGKRFLLMPFTAADAIADIAPVQAFLFEKGLSGAGSFFDKDDCFRIEFPARPFRRTRCWLRESPKQKSDCPGPGKAKPASSAAETSRFPTLFKLIGQHWMEVLDLPAISPRLHFFESGGDSLKASQVIRKINSAVAIRLDFEDLFDYPELDSFTGYVWSRLTVTSKLLLIWKDVLRYPDLTVDQDFFELGGHSLTANQILNRINADLDVRIDFDDFFRHRTVTELASLIAERGSAGEDRIGPCLPAETYPATLLQRRLWILCQADSASMAYQELNVYQLEGPLHIDFLKKSLEEVFRHHDSFRTIFRDAEQGLRQVILPYGSSFETIVDEPEHPDSSTVAGIIRAFGAHRFDLAAGPLVRTALIRESADRWLFLFHIHHIIFDEWSNRLFLTELVQTYLRLQAEQEPQLSPRSLQFRDYACWEERRGDSQLEMDETWWLNHLSAGVPVLDLPTDFPRPAHKSYEGAVLSRPLPADIANYVRALSREGQASTFMTFVALLNALFHRYTGQQRIVLGTPVAGRPLLELEKIIGFFANTVLLSNAVDGSDGFMALLSRVKTGVLGAFAHQGYPFDRLVEKLDIPTDQSRLPLFDVMVGYQRGEAGTGDHLDMAGVNVSAYGHWRDSSKFDLAVDLFESGDRLTMNITYCTALYREDSIDRLFRHFCCLIRSIAAGPERPIGKAGYLDLDDLAAQLRSQLPPDLPPSGDPTGRLRALASANHHGLIRVVDPDGNCAGIGIRGILHVCEDDSTWTPTDLAASLRADGLIRIRGSISGSWLVNGTRIFREDLGLALSDFSEVSGISWYLPADHTRPVLIAEPTITPQSGGTVQEVTAIRRSRVLTEEEKRLLDQMNQMDHQATSLPAMTTILDCLRSWAIAGPDRIAIRCEDRSITYGELQTRSELLARHLLSAGIQKGQPVPVYGRRSADWLVGMLGIFISGGAYLPLPPDNPADRLAAILDDCGASVLLVWRRAFEEQYNAAGRESLAACVDRLIVLDEVIGGADLAGPLPIVGAEDLAYILYTSGSTGRPKGVMIQHGGMLNHLLAKNDLLRMTPASSLAQTATQSFDISIWQFLCPLTCGGQVFVYPDTIVRSPALLAERLVADHPDFMQAVPSYLAVLLDVWETQAATRRWQPSAVVTSGEVLPPILARRWFSLFPGVPLINAYGPTEAADNVTHYRFDRLPEDIVRIPIGRPIANTRLYVLDEEGQQCPVGETGEICIAGIGVARGYINNPEKTAEVFRDNPLCPGERLYHTGDLGFVSGDGQLEFLGRRDHQVKIRGFRIETGEVEYWLGRIDGIHHALILPFGRADGDAFLAAYFIGDPDLHEVSILDQLQQKLPAYMLPARLFRCDEFPVTPNGKVDRKAFVHPDRFSRLPALEKTIRRHLRSKLPAATIPEKIVAVERRPMDFLSADCRDRLLLDDKNQTADSSQTDAPVSETERRLLSCWSAVFPDLAGIDLDFFEAGGHSLKGMRLLALIEKEFGIRLGLRALFDCPTVRLLAPIIDSQRATAPQPLHLPKAPSAARYPVSFSQRRMWLMEKTGGAGHAYHIGGALRLSGPWHFAELRHAWRGLIGGHEALRTLFTADETGIYQRILDRPVEPADLLYLDRSEALPSVDAWLAAFQQQCFDLEKGPLLRGVLIRLDTQEHLLVFVLHHIIADEWSLGLLQKELFRLYRSGDDAATEPAWHYRDYAVWQAREQDEANNASRGYWLSQMAAATVLDLPADRPRPAAKSWNGADTGLVLPGMARRLAALSGDAGTTVFTTLMASLKILLFRYSGQPDITIGTPVSGRFHPDLQDSVGLYLNTLPIRSSLQTTTSFTETLIQERQVILDAFTHQDYPFDKLVDELGLRRDNGRSPLFDVWMVMHEDRNDLQEGWEDGLLKVAPYSNPANTSKFDLNWHFRRHGDDLELGLNYNTDLYDAARARLILDHFVELLGSALSEPFRAVGELSYIPSAERNLLTPPDHNTPTPPESDILTVLEAVWRHKGSQWMLRGLEGGLRYGEAGELSDRIASVLRSVYGVKPGSVVGLWLDPGVEWVVSMLGVLKAGGTYLPLDRDFPLSRLSWIAEDSGAELVIGPTGWEGPERSVSYPELLAAGAGSSEPEKAAGRTAESVAYLIYTSGSTGRPKGVEVRDGSVVNYVKGIGSVYGWKGQELRGLLCSSPAFDLGYTCLWGMLLSGGCLYMGLEGGHWEPRKVLDRIDKEGITIVKLTPSHFRLLRQAAEDRGRGGESLRWVVLGGERIEGPEVRWWLERYPQSRVANHYGPTETTIGVLTQVVGWEEGEGMMGIEEFCRRPVLGRAMGGHRVYVVDEWGELCGRGVWGELWIGGPGVSRGYRNRGELNEEKFVADKFRLTGEKVYRTGDRCRWDMEGRIEFGGRLDGQVKWKGYRIEPGEIESVLVEMKGVKSAAVGLKGEGPGERLVAYVVAEGEKAIETEWRSILRSRLPGYMLPSCFVWLSALPLTGNGKIDRQGLPDPEEEEGEEEREVVKASGDREERLLWALEGVLGRKGLSMGDDFFGLGGDSIRAIQVSSRLYREGWELEVKDIFGYPVLSEMAGRMRPLQGNIDQGPVEGLVPLSPIQREFFGRGLLYPHHYNQSLLLRSERRLEADILRRVLEELHTHHDALRMLFRRTSAGWEQYNRAPGVAVEVRELDVSDRPAGELTGYAQQVQESLLPETGPLLKAVIFHTADGDRLLLVAHHLVVDGVSWRILLEDLGGLYDQALQGAALRLPPKTDSFRAWSEALEAEVKTEGFAERQSYWRRRKDEEDQEVEEEEEGEGEWLSATGETGLRVEQFGLDEEQTEQLLREVNGVYHTEINDILLSALSLAWREAYGRRRVRVMLEGHGRQGGPGLKVSRTVGWFTTVYPVWLDSGEEEDTGAVIRGIKEQLRAIPDKGMGYGLLRYLYEGGETLTAGPASIVFNYLGQLDQDVTGNGFALATENPGRMSDPRESIRYPIAITARISNGKYSMTFESDRSRIPAMTAGRLTQACRQALETIITHCTRIARPAVALSSFQYTSLTTDTLSTLFD